MLMNMCMGQACLIGDGVAVASTVKRGRGPIPVAVQIKPAQLVAVFGQ